MAHNSRSHRGARFVSAGAALAVAAMALPASLANADTVTLGESTTSVFFKPARVVPGGKTVLELKVTRFNLEGTADQESTADAILRTGDLTQGGAPWPAWLTLPGCTPPRPPSDGYSFCTLTAVHRTRTEITYQANIPITIPADTKPGMSVRVQWDVSGPGAKDTLAIVKKPEPKKPKVDFTG
jgi:hypothetical protein